MSDRFDGPTLAKIIDAPYSTEAKVAAILSLYEQHRIRQLNEIGNKLGRVIDSIKEEG